MRFDRRGRVPRHVPGGQGGSGHPRGAASPLTVAPTRAGKGVAAIVPNLLTYPGAAFVSTRRENARHGQAPRRTRPGRHLIDQNIAAAKLVKPGSIRSTCCAPTMRSGGERDLCRPLVVSGGGANDRSGTTKRGP